VKSSGYVFVLTPIELREPCNQEVIAGHRLVRADESQIDEIKQKIEQFNTNPFFNWVSPYENDIQIVPGSKAGEFSFPSKPLAREDWRYWIIEFDGTNVELGELQSACELITNDLELGFHFTSHEGVGKGFGWNPSVLHTFFHEHKPVTCKLIDQAALAEINGNFYAIKALSNDYEHISRALRRFHQLKWLPRSSEMVVIGLFSVIESLVSHAPKLTESADSLGHQLRTKLPMLARQFHSDLNHANFFTGLSEEKLWSKLYGYRSKIVHGEDSQLSGDLKDLKNIDAVIHFLRETSKKVLSLCLKEPQFMTDLKKC
jgi:hypothetical protein